MRNLRKKSGQTEANVISTEKTKAVVVSKAAQMKEKFEEFKDVAKKCEVAAIGRPKRLLA